MISKIQSNNYNVNFQSKVYITNGAADVMEQNLNLLQFIKYRAQVLKLQKNKEMNEVIIRAFHDYFGKGVDLVLKAKDDLVGMCSFHFRLEEVKDFNIIQMYNHAKKHLRNIKK